MNRHFTFKDYADALKNAGPKTTENLLQRAIKDPDISFGDVIKLEDLADEKENARKQSPCHACTAPAKTDIAEKPPFVG